MVVDAGRATSTIASNGTVRPSVARTVNVSRSAAPKCSAPAKRTLTGISTSPRWNSRREEPRSAIPMNCATWVR
jgi:hypothetical protein